MNEPKDQLRTAVGGTAGAVAGTATGLAGSAAAISSAGAVAGLSGADITSGLSAIGGSILGGAAVLSCGVALLAVGGAAGRICLTKRISNSRNKTVANY